MVIVDFRKEHYESLQKDNTLEILNGLLEEKHLLELEKSQHSKTILDNEGNVIACCGAVEFWSTRAEAWFMVKKDVCIKELISIRKLLTMLLDGLPFDRVEAAVESNFVKGHKWVKILGFKSECVQMVKYFPNGSTGSLYARVK